MSRQEDDDGPVYYREIQKNDYLTRIPEDSGGKLLPLGHKKPPPRPLWTQLCIHNGTAAYLEQYASPAASAAHAPLWRASLMRARHVTAGVRADFRVHTRDEVLRLRAERWEQMQDWVATLRDKLAELRVVPRGENVYCGPPAAPAPRAAARDPTSPLPPVPQPPDRVPGIEIIPTRAPEVRSEPEPEPEPEAAPAEVTEPPPTEPPPPPPPADVSQWGRALKICGQSICLDDSVLARREEDDNDNDDEDDLSGVGRDHATPDTESAVDDHRHTVRVNEGDDSQNVTVIQVSNKQQAPHTAIPVLGPETDVFVFDPKQNGGQTQNGDRYVNIVNTEVDVTSENSYGTVFGKESHYGHLSLTTTVNLTDAPVSVTAVSGHEGVYEKLCLASTSRSPLPSRKLLTSEKRKSSLPNLNLEGGSSSPYEYLYPGNDSDRRPHPVAAASGVTTTSINTNATENVVSTGSSISTVNASTNSTREVSNGRSVVSLNQFAEPISTVLPVNAVTVNNSAIMNPNTVALRAVERSHSQNSYDRAGVRERLVRRDEVEVKNDKQPKPLWRRGLTELSLLTRLRGARRPDSPPRRDPPPAPPRDAARDPARRRSSSLSNGSPPPSRLLSLAARQHASLRSAQRRNAALLARALPPAPALLTAHAHSTWVVQWNPACNRHNGRAGDRVLAIRGVAPAGLPHARSLLKGPAAAPLDILFQRVPLGKIYLLKKETEHESIGIKIDAECNIVSVTPRGPAARAALPPPGAWAVTEVNDRPLPLLKGGQEDLNRLSLCGREVTVLIQPSDFVRKLRSALKNHKSILGLR